MDISCASLQSIRGQQFVNPHYLQSQAPVHPRELSKEQLTWENRLSRFVEVTSGRPNSYPAHRIKKVATVLGFGPRFLHSTGQAYKGGPNTGVFLQITCDDAVDLLVPGQKYTFGVVKAAQARGDFAVLAERGRRALRVHLGKNVAAGLAALTEAVSQALG